MGPQYMQCPTPLLLSHHHSPWCVYWEVHTHTLACNLFFHFATVCSAVLLQPHKPRQFVQERVHVVVGVEEDVVCSQAGMVGIFWGVENPKKNYRGHSPIAVIGDWISPTIDENFKVGIIVNESSNVCFSSPLEILFCLRFQENFKILNGYDENRKVWNRDRWMYGHKVSINQGKRVMVFTNPKNWEFRNSHWVN